MTRKKTRKDLLIRKIRTFLGEFLSLVLDEVDRPWKRFLWGGNKMLVRSPKTEHHPGGESRLVPIFPGLSILLTLALAEAEPGPGYVIAKHRKTGLNQWAVQDLNL